jgi:uncharacterized protein (UPF0335 family)
MSEGERRVRAAFVRLHLGRLRSRAFQQNRSAAMARDDNPGNGSGEDDKTSIAAQELRLYVERVERLEEEQKGINEDKAEVYSEMKGRGYDTKIVKKLIAIRRKKKGEHEEESMLLETYMAALGMI